MNFKNLMTFLWSNPIETMDAGHIVMYIWLLFFVAQIILAYISVPKGLTERLIILFQKQHLSLLFAAIIMSGYIFSPVIHLETGAFKNDLMAKDMSKNIGFPIIGHYFVFVCMVGAIVTACLNLIAIFLYKKRGIQIVFCWLSVLTALFCVGYVFFKFKTSEMIQDQWFWYGNISPVIAVIFIIAAIISIRKDDELVKSVDRLR